MTHSRWNPHRWRRRAAGMYLMTFMTGTLIMGSATALVSMQMSQRRITKNIADAVQTEYYSQAGLEWAFNTFGTDPTWRGSTLSGDTLPLTLRGAVVTATITDPIDGDFSDDDTDSAFLSVTTTNNGSTVTYTSTMTPEPHEALAHNVHAFGFVNLDATVTVEGHVYADDGLLALLGVNDTATARFTTLDSAVVLAPGLTVSLVSQSSDPPIIGLSDYIALATSVLPNGTTEYIIDGAMFSATSGWKYPPNADGVYHIDCAGKQLTLNNVVVRGTLIITNAGDSNILFTGYGRFEQGAGGLPALLIDSPTSTVWINLQSATDETLISKDLNEDGDQLDILDSGFFDLSWMKTTSVDVSGLTIIDGALITTKIAFHDTTVIRNNTALANALIRGFTDNFLHPVPGSIRELR